MYFVLDHDGTELRAFRAALTEAKAFDLAATMVDVAAKHRRTATPAIVKASSLIELKAQYPDYFTALGAMARTAPLVDRKTETQKRRNLGKARTKAAMRAALDRLERVQWQAKRKARAAEDRCAQDEYFKREDRKRERAEHEKALTLGLISDSKGSNVYQLNRRKA